MTINEAITKTDELKPNSYPYLTKVKWLSTIDERVRHLMDRYADAERADDNLLPYDEQTDPNALLLLPSAFDELYVHYISAQIDYFNEEYDRFNNSNAMFDGVWGDFERWYNRNHTPYGCKNVYF